MTIHKWTKLTPVKRREIADKYFKENVRISVLAKTCQVSRNTIHNVIRRAKLKDFSVHKSINKRYRTVQYGLRRLAKIEAACQQLLCNPFLGIADSIANLKQAFMRIYSN